MSVSPPLQGMIPSPASTKHVYGGLVPMNQKQGTRAYQDAATYNQHLAQHQTYTAQQAQAAQASTAYRNPYVTPQDYQQQQQQQAQSVQQLPTPSSQYSASMQPPPSAAQRALVHHGSNGNLRSAAAAASTNMYAQQAQAASNPVPPPSTYYPAGGRNRANTLGASGGVAVAAQLGPAPMSVTNQMDVVPPALARLSQMGALEIPGGGGRNALTPVMNRDDAMREWERRGGAGAKATAYPPALEYLSQQAEMQPASWSHHQHHQQQQQRSYAPTQPSGLGYQSHGGPPSGVTSAPPASQADRDAVMGSVRAAAGLGVTGVQSVAPPAAVYGAPRYDAGPQTLYVPTQGQYAGGVPTSPARAQTQAQQAAAAAYYSPQQTAQVQQRNLFAAQQQQPQMSPAMGGNGASKRASQMDWPR